MSRRRRKKGKGTSQKPAVPAQQPPHTGLQFFASGTSYSGPIPPPEMLQRFNEIIPKGAHRILKMAEKQQTHRHRLEAKVITSDIWRSWGGLIFGVLITLMAIYAGYLLASNGHEWSGTTIATGPIIGLVYTFVTGTTKRQKEREAKASAILPRK